ncbi:acid resistance repetitive basic protein Asr, partial [Yersinia enterocolitica]|nr:acid-shock protein [Yersinia enterocolitica]
KKAPVQKAQAAKKHVKKAPAQKAQAAKKHHKTAKKSATAPAA